MDKYRFSPEIRQSLKPLLQLNNWRGVLGVTGDYVVIAFAVFLSLQSYWFYPLSVLLIGSRQRALTSILHEACHLTLARHRGLNNFLGRWMAGCAVFQSYDAYRKSHVVNHHCFLGDPDRDPDYINCIETGLAAVRTPREFMRGFVLKTILLGNVPNYLKYLFVNRLAAITRNPVEMVGLLLVQGLIFAALQASAGIYGYLLFWLVPLLTSFQVVGWLSEIAEHYRLYERKSSLEMTRNRFPAWWERIFIGMHGDNYHQTHHLFAGIPFWNLKRAHAVLLNDPAYRALNEFNGGIVSAPGGRKSVLRQVSESLELSATARAEPSTDTYLGGQATGEKDTGRNAPCVAIPDALTQAS